MNSNLWYAIPLVIAVSLVYAATRHEEGRDILLHSVRVAVWIVGFMLVVFAILFAISWYLASDGNHLPNAVIPLELTF